MRPVREVTFEAAYDKRDPTPSKNYGVHGLHIWFTLRDTEQGDGLTFSVSTNWHLPNVQAEVDQDAANRPDWQHRFKPMAFSVDYHGLRPCYEGQAQSQIKCEVTGKHCYCNGSGLLGEEFLATLIAEGDEGLWKRMEEQLLTWRPK